MVPWGHSRLGKEQEQSKVIGKHLMVFGARKRTGEPGKQEYSGACQCGKGGEFRMVARCRQTVEGLDVYSKESMCLMRSPHRAFG